MNLSLKLGEGVNLDLRRRESAAHVEDAADDFTLFTCGPLVMPRPAGVTRLSLEIQDEAAHALTLSADAALHIARAITSAARTVQRVRAGRQSGPTCVYAIPHGGPRHLPFKVDRAGTC